MTASYDRAAIPEPFQILGLRLKPFCLGHFLLLRRFECGFVSEASAVATREDLLLGILVCSMSYEEFLDFLQEDNFLEQLRDWGKKAGLFDLKEKALLFQRYLTEGTEKPGVWFEEDGEESAAHWSQAVFNTLAGQLNASRSEALNMPLTQAFMDFYKHAEGLGVISFMTEEEMELVESEEKLTQRRRDAESAKGEEEENSKLQTPTSNKERGKSGT
jgi:hypothetical protein